MLALDCIDHDGQQGSVLLPCASLGTMWQKMFLWHAANQVVRKANEMNLSGAVNQVIDLGGKVRAYYETELRKRFPHYPLGDLQEEENVPPPPEEKELSDFLAT